MTASPRSKAAPRLSILIPALNEATTLGLLLPTLQPLRHLGHQIVLCDGGSTDGTPELASPWVDQVVSAARGRALQMNAAARQASGDILVFLHADTRPPAHFHEAVLHAMQGMHRWGRFDVALDSKRPSLRMVAAMMNLRSRWTGIATGDQTVFVDRRLFERIGGFPEIALMEDIALSRLLKRDGPPACLREKMTTSARRWERDGVLRTILRMWRLRLAYWLGTDPARLATLYYGKPR